MNRPGPTRPRPSPRFASGAGSSEQDRAWARPMALIAACDRKPDNQEGERHGLLSWEECRERIFAGATQSNHRGVGKGPRERAMPEVQAQRIHSYRWICKYISNTEPGWRVRSWGSIRPDGADDLHPVRVHLATCHRCVGPLAAGGEAECRTRQVTRSPAS